MRSTAAESPRRRRPIEPIVVVLVTLVLCGLWGLTLHQAEQTVFAQVPLLDEVYYLDRAAEISAGRMFPDDPFFMSPLYPALIAGVGSGQIVPDDRVVPAANLRPIRLLQIACWFGVVGLLRLIMGRILGPATEDGPKRYMALWLPSLLFVLYLPAAVYCLSLLLEGPLTLLVTASIWVMSLVLTTPSSSPGGRAGLLIKAAMLGLLIGAAALLRGTALVIWPIAFVVVWRCGQVRSQRLLALGLLLVLTVAVLAPPVIHNSRLAGRLVGPTLNGGVNLYIGNGPQANGFYVAVVPGDWRHDPAGRAFLAQRFDLPEVSLATADKLWTQGALAEIKASPQRALGLWLKKIWLFCQGWQIDQLTPVSGWRDQAPILRLWIVPYGLIAALGLATLAGRWYRQRSLWLLVTVLGLLLMSQSVFFTVSRYRLVLVPILALMAAFTLDRGLQDWRRVVPGLGLALLLIMPWGLTETRQLWSTQAKANEAQRWAVVAAAQDSETALNKATDLYLASIAGNPPNPAPWLGLASVLVQAREPARACRHLVDSLDVVTENLDLHKMLITLLIQDDRPDEALIRVRALLADHPDDPDGLHNLAILASGQGRLGEAMASARQLMDDHPNDPRGFIDLGILLARSGRNDKAVDVFRLGLMRHPNHPDLLHNLSLLTDD